MKTRAGCWAWTTDLFFSRAVDQHYDQPGEFGLFLGDGWCLVGVVVCLGGRTRPPRQFGLVLCNVFVGVWYDENPDAGRAWSNQWRVRLGLAMWLIGALALALGALAWRMWLWN